MKNYFDLTGRVAIVTGCSTGLGVQMAKALANQGCKIVCLARRKAMVDQVAADLTAGIHGEHGVRPHVKQNIVLVRRDVHRKAVRTGQIVAADGILE